MGSRKHILIKLLIFHTIVGEIIEYGERIIRLGTDRQSWATLTDNVRSVQTDSDRLKATKATAAQGQPCSMIYIKTQNPALPILTPKGRGRFVPMISFVPHIKEPSQCIKK